MMIPKVLSVWFRNKRLCMILLGLLSTLTVAIASIVASIYFYGNNQKTIPRDNTHSHAPKMRKMVSKASP
ncbi:hypothetical protein [Richelia sinica]|uniref:hypothetical protein n=1 Tax=Richelia sinica TaxID=1357545 RepID=UPI001685FCD4|nr:hypothetical protein [Richelia sinica]MBD2665296.1 hypothetical protein [Richelia sinica FACHB-800]